jgi:hypothetical protein
MTGGSDLGDGNQAPAYSSTNSVTNLETEGGTQAFEDKVVAAYGVHPRNRDRDLMDSSDTSIVDPEALGTPTIGLPSSTNLQPTGMAAHAMPPSVESLAETTYQLYLSVRIVVIV